MRGSGAISLLVALLSIGGYSRPGQQSEVSLELQVRVEGPLVARQHVTPQQRSIATTSQPAIAFRDLECEIPTVEQIKSMLYRPGCGSNRLVGELSDNERTILRWGARAFPAYEAILADSASDVVDVEGVCIAIHQLKLERRRFIPLLVNRLTAPDALVQAGSTQDWDVEIDERNATYIRNAVRSAAIELLGEIGSEQETVHVRQYLYNDDYGIQYAVLSALTKLGGQRDLDAVNAWLCNPWPIRPEVFIRRVKQCRDKIEVRLKANAKSQVVSGVANKWLSLSPRSSPPRMSHHPPTSSRRGRRLGARGQRG
jgi:hypothetical protein